MEFTRASGILLHPTSMPGRFGIGDLGRAAYQFIDFLVESGQQLWQIMPLGPTSYGDSPYQTLSAFAGNPMLISLEQLAEDEFLAPWDLDDAPGFPDHFVDYGEVIPFKQRLLRLSFRNFLERASAAHRADLEGFTERNRAWIDDFALFVALKEHFGEGNWSDWDLDVATRSPAALEQWRVRLKDAVEYHKYAQYQFFRQWHTLKSYANEQGIRVVGDIPIFVAYDSADAWSHPELFLFDAEGKPTFVAGVPPDYFSATGQLWGNPLYRWDVMAENGYAWWVERFRTTLETVDVVRLDHFRGFESYWAVPADEETAVNGKWVKGPGADLFRVAESAIGELNIIVEDLGLITSKVKALRKELGYPGMKVLQFAFYGDPDHPYLPHNYEENCVVYTGTHDNDTTRGWYDNVSAEVRHHARVYLGRHGDDIAWDLIRLALMSVAHSAIFPLQDVLNLGSEARMNVPGQATDNWTWRYTEDMLSESVRARLKDLTTVYGRAPRPEELLESDEGKKSEYGP